jgi:multidrug efflux pump subunit AcrA (membrane-fusion protein)
VERVAVRSGLQFGEQVEILEGLKDGDQVVSKGFLDLRAGKKVQVVNGAKPAGAKASQADMPARQE